MNHMYIFSPELRSNICLQIVLSRDITYHIFYITFDNHFSTYLGIHFPYFNALAGEIFNRSSDGVCPCSTPDFTKVLNLCQVMFLVR